MIETVMIIKYLIFTKYALAKSLTCIILFHNKHNHKGYY